MAQLPAWAKELSSFEQEQVYQTIRMLESHLADARKGPGILGNTQIAYALERLVNKPDPATLDVPWLLSKVDEYGPGLRQIWTSIPNYYIIAMTGTETVKNTEGRDITAIPDERGMITLHRLNQVDDDLAIIRTIGKRRELTLCTPPAAATRLQGGVETYTTFRANGMSVEMARKSLLLLNLPKIEPTSITLKTGNQNGAKTIDGH